MFQFANRTRVERFDCTEERAMRDRAVEQINRILANLRRFERRPGTVRAGLEGECALTRPDLSLAPQEIQRRIVTRYPEWAIAELGAHQLEFISPRAIDLIEHGIKSLEVDMEQRMETVRRHAKARNTRMFCTGSYPFAPIDDIVATNGRAEYLKYTLVPAFNQRHRRACDPILIDGERPIDIGNTHVVAFMNAIQMTLDAISADDAVDALNRLIMIGPYAQALGANARFLELADTGYCDVRYHAWSASHDIRTPEEIADGWPTRIGLPADYYTSLEDYFNRLLSYPAILGGEAYREKALGVFIGLYWRTARIKIFEHEDEAPTLGVEFRACSMQPTAFENAALMLFVLGRLAWSKMHNEPLLPFSIVRDNERQATRHGLSECARLATTAGDRWWIETARRALLKEVNRAQAGLESLFPEPDQRREIKRYMEPLRKRLSLGSPSEQLARRVRKLEDDAGAAMLIDPEIRQHALLTAMEEQRHVLPAAV